MENIKLGKLKEVPLRKVWKHEQYAFSAWLADEENISELGEVLGLTLTDVETEKAVGNYRCDILCKDEITGKTVLIENQLEPTNHDHLGKIITYASGLDASVIVWIVESARDEHASAIEWLNKHTDGEISFFLIEVHAYQIGNSEPAPQFKIIEQPNDFVNNIKAIEKNSTMNESMSQRLEFWTKLNEILIQKGEPFNKRKATTDHWYDVAMGSSKCHVSIELVNKNNLIRISIWVNENKAQYDNFFANKDAIEAGLGYSLEWNRNDSKKASRIYTSIPGLDFEDHSNYGDLIEKSIVKAVEFKKVFKNYLI